MLLLVRPANGKKSGSCQLGKFFLYSSSLKEIVIVCLQLHLLFSYSSQFKSDIKKAFEPNKLA